MDIQSDEQYAEYVLQLAKQYKISQYGHEDYKGFIPPVLINFLKESKVFYQLVPEEMGGGNNVSRWFIALREVGSQCNTTVHIMTTHSLSIYALRIAGEIERKPDLYRSLIELDKQSCFCLTEPGGGSDASSLKTVAVKSESGYLISGDKCMIMNADFADYLLVAAKLSDVEGYAGITLFMIPRETPGITVDPPDQTMGARGVPINSVHFNQVLATEDMMIGGAGNGWKILMRVLDRTRPGVASAALGAARTAMEKAVVYSQKRVAFGKPISRYQTISNRIADMTMRWNSAWLMTQDAGRRIDTGDRALSLASAMAKITATEAAVDIANEALLVFGGYGFLEEYGMAEICRNLRVTTIYDGTNDVLRGIVAGSFSKAVSDSLKENRVSETR
jgi:alkylation response protein AidB-like acyl-CoA dehydrogenase